MPTEKPSWLRAMENGTIGEARSRAFLLDRFWILERSVDVDGADLIIQRRVSAVNLLDEKPPRFGVVQCKFFQDDRTTQYVHREYAVGPSNTKRSEFFLLCHTGIEERARMFLIPAASLVADFEVVKIGDNALKFRLSGPAALSSKYEIVSPSIALNRIESMLESADFRSNRSFISWASPSIREEMEQIEPVYKEPLHNWWDNIPKAFRKLKEDAQSAIFSIDEVRDEVAKILSSTDPEQALKVAEELSASHQARGKIEISFDDLWDEDFWTAVQEHKRRVAVLTKAGLFDRYLSLQEGAIRFVMRELEEGKVSSKPGAYYVLTTRYDPKTLNLTGYSSKMLKTGDLKAKFGDKRDSSRSEVLFSEAGKIVSCTSSDRLKKTVTKYSRSGSSEVEVTWAEAIRYNSWELIYPAMDKVFLLLFPGLERPD